MSRFETTQRKHCPYCGTTTVHDVTIYLDEDHEITYCTECGQ